MAHRKIKGNRRNNRRQYRKRVAKLENLGDNEVFSDDFESGSLVTNWPTRTGAVSAIAGAAFEGGFGARIAPAGAAATIATSTTKWTQATYPWFRISCRMKFNTLQASGTADLITVQNALQTDNMDLFLNNTDKAFRIDLSGGEGIALDTGLIPVIGTWYYIQIIGLYDTTYRTRLKIDGTLYDWLEDTGETASTIRSLHFGTGSAKTYSFDIDNVVMTVSEGEPIFS